MTRLLVPCGFLVALTLSGCALFTGKTSKADVERQERQALCKEVRDAQRPAHRVRNGKRIYWHEYFATTPRIQALNLACSGDERPYGMTGRRWYSTMRDRTADPVMVATYTIGQVEHHRKPRAHCDERCLMGYVVGHLTQTRDIEARVKQLGLPTDVGARLAWRFDQAMATAKKRLAATPAGDRKVYAEAPLALLKHRQAFYRENAAHYARLDAALAAPSHAARADMLRDARSHYTKEKRALDPSYDRFLVEVNFELFKALMAAGLYVEATAERQLLDGQHRGSRLYLLLWANSAWWAVNDARKRTTTLTKAKFTKAESIYPEELPNIREAVTVEAVVAKVRHHRARGTTTVTFKGRKSRWPQSYACRRGKKILVYQRVGRRVEARTDYEERCKTRMVTKVHEPAPPVTVQSREGKLLRPGDTARVTVDRSSRAGFLVRAKRKKKTVAMRDYRVAPSK